MLCNYHANRSMGMIFIIFRLVLEVWETGILQTIKIKSNLYKLKYDDMSSAIVAAQFLYSLTVRFRAVGRFENPGVPVVIRWT